MNNIGHGMILSPEERAARRRNYSNRINSLKNPSVRNPDRSTISKNTPTKKDISRRMMNLDKKEPKNMFLGIGDQAARDMTNTISKRNNKKLNKPEVLSKNNYKQGNKDTKRFYGVAHKPNPGLADGTSPKRANKKFNIANTLNKNIRAQSNRNIKPMDVKNKKDEAIFDEDIDIESNQNLINDLYSNAKKEIARNRTTFVDGQYDDEENDRKLVNNNQDLIRDLYEKYSKDVISDSDISTDDSYDDKEIFITDNDRKLVDDLPSANAENKDSDDIEKLIDDIISKDENDDDEIIENDLKNNQNLIEDFYSGINEDMKPNKK